MPSWKHKEFPGCLLSKHLRRSRAFVGFPFICSCSFTLVLPSMALSCPSCASRPCVRLDHSAWRASFLRRVSFCRIHCLAGPCRGAMLRPVDPLIPAMDLPWTGFIHGADCKEDGCWHRVARKTQVDTTMTQKTPVSQDHHHQQHQQQQQQQQLAHYTVQQKHSRRSMLVSLLRGKSNCSLSTTSTATNR